MLFRAESRLLTDSETAGFITVQPKFTEPAVNERPKLRFMFKKTDDQGDFCLHLCCVICSPAPLAVWWLLRWFCELLAEILTFL